MPIWLGCRHLEGKTADRQLRDWVRYGKSSRRIGVDSASIAAFFEAVHDHEIFSTYWLPWCRYLGK